MAEQQTPATTPADYDEYGDEPQQDEKGSETDPLKPDEALTDPA